MAAYLLISQDEQVQGAVRLLTEHMRRMKGVLGKTREVMERHDLDTCFLYRPGEMEAKVCKEKLVELGRAQKRTLTVRLKGKSTMVHMQLKSERCRRESHPCMGQGRQTHTRKPPMHGSGKANSHEKATHAWVREGKLT